MENGVIPWEKRRPETKPYEEIISEPRLRGERLKTLRGYFFAFAWLSLAAAAYSIVLSSEAPVSEPWEWLRLALSTDRDEAVRFSTGETFPPEMRFLQEQAAKAEQIGPGMPVIEFDRDIAAARKEVDLSGLSAVPPEKRKTPDAVFSDLQALQTGVLSGESIKDHKPGTLSVIAVVDGHLRWVQFGVKEFESIPAVAALRAAKDAAQAAAEALKAARLAERAAVAQAQADYGTPAGQASAGNAAALKNASALAEQAAAKANADVVAARAQLGWVKAQCRALLGPTPPGCADTGYEGQGGGLPIESKRVALGAVADQYMPKGVQK